MVDTAKVFRSASLRILAALLLLLYVGGLSGAAFAQDPTGAAAPKLASGAETMSSGDAVPEKQVTVKLVADTTEIVPGKPFRLGAQIEMIPHWHTYYKDSGEAGMPTQIKWQLPPGFTASELLWKQPRRFTDAGITTFGYEDQTLIGAMITPPADLKPGSKLTFGATVKWLACKDMCVPGKAALTIDMVSAPTATLANATLFGGLGWTGDVKSLQSAGAGSPKGGASAVAPATFTGSILDANIKLDDNAGQRLDLIAYLGLAFVGGFILNFMPCVLPVISIKVLSFMQQAGDDPKRVFRLGIAFTAGILSAFLALGGAVIGVQQAGQKIGWGFQFQYPLFLFAMSAVVLMFALSLFGLFYVQFNAGQDKIDSLASKDGYTGTFFKGVLATTLSTPCSAPFLGTALGFAFSQPPYMVLLMFATIGVGMAFPYVLLTGHPAWMKFLPKPGVWMEKFKESMGFLLLATVVWLVWVLGQQVGINATMAAIGFLVAISFVVWMVGRFTDLTSTSTRKAVVYAIAAVVMTASYFTMLKPYPELLSMQPAQSAPVPTASKQSTSPYQVANNVSESLDWKPFSIDALDSELKAGKTVFLDFTADWCLTCKVNESTVIATNPVINKIKQLNVVTMRADWTRQDPQISSLLQKFGRSGVPLYVVFPGSRPTEPIVLPEVITQDMVVEKLNEAGPSR